MHFNVNPVVCFKIKVRETQDGIWDALDIGYVDVTVFYGFCSDAVFLV